ncbi:MAG: HipA domain-containing protein, partial [Eggerthellaceae bacterium]|nr:HipA domain-containing protein [Eggerthellaceae bacterium]
RTYMLMNGTYPVILFAYDQNDGAFLIREVIDPTRAPIGTISRNGRAQAAGLQRWWQHRSIPGSRDGITSKLAELGLDDASDIPFRNLGFSLSDQYWIQPEDAQLDWGKLNYFQNRFGNEEKRWDNWLSAVGLSSPDNTSEGMLPKKWVCEGRRRLLLKGHVPWTDQQVYNEVVATALHTRVLPKGEFVPYENRTVDGLGAVSVCPCFVRPNEEYVPASLVMDSEGHRKGEATFDALMRHATNLGIPRKEASLRLSKMIVCDGIVANADRHLRNFGFIRNIDTLEWRFAPLFDTGNSLWFDKDEDAVARGDYSFDSRPFEVVPNRQLMLTVDDAWFDLEMLDGFEEEAATILEQGNVSRWRLDYLRKGIAQRLAALRVIWG